MMWLPVQVDVCKPVLNHNDHMTHCEEKCSYLQRLEHTPAEMKVSRQNILLKTKISHDITSLQQTNQIT